MKITNEQLRQIIKEELNKVLEVHRPRHYIRPPEFDSRTGKKPEHEEKLTTLYMGNDESREQAKRLAGDAGQAIDIPVDASNTEDDHIIQIFDKTKRKRLEVKSYDDEVDGITEVELRWVPNLPQYWVVTSSDRVSHQMKFDSFYEAKQAFDNFGPKK